MSKMLGLVVAGAVALGAIGVGTAYASLGQFTGIVLRVIDGDTLVATVKGQEATIRLLNVDTPETKDPNRAPECLGPEASDFLSDRLPIGTRIGLKYDKDRTDQYGRTLAAVYQSESLINAEIARAGLGAAVLFEPNRKYYNEVRAAQQAAQETRVGLYDSQVGCTLPAEVDPVVQSLEQTSSQVPVDSSAATSAMDAAAVALRAAAGDLDVLSAGEQRLLGEWLDRVVHAD